MIPIPKRTLFTAREVCRLLDITKHHFNKCIKLSYITKHASSTRTKPSYSSNNVEKLRTLLVTLDSHGLPTNETNVAKLVNKMKVSEILASRGIDPIAEIANIIAFTDNEPIKAKLLTDVLKYVYAPAAPDVQPDAPQVSIAFDFNEQRTT